MGPPHGAKWGADGRELFYQSGQDTLMVVAVREGDGHLAVGLPTPLFDIPVVQREQADDYAVSPDGQRFLVKTRVEAKRGQDLHVVANWHTVGRLAPSGRSNSANARTTAPWSPIESPMVGALDRGRFR